MRIYLKLNEKSKELFQVTKNTLFTCSKDGEFSLSPIPPFLDGAKCGCGKIAKVILNDSECVCLDCIKSNFVASKLITEDSISNPITIQSIRNIKFDWSIDGLRWYTVYGRGLKPDDWVKFVNKLKYIILGNKSLFMEADYDRDKKELKIIKF